MVARTLLNVTLYVRCVSCWNINTIVCTESAEVALVEAHGFSLTVHHTAQCAVSCQVHFGRYMCINLQMGWLIKRFFAVVTGKRALQVKNCGKYLRPSLRSLAKW